VAKVWIDVANADPGGAFLRCARVGGCRFPTAGEPRIGVVWVDSLLLCARDFDADYTGKAFRWSDDWPDTEAGMVWLAEGLPADLDDGDWAGPWTDIAAIPTGTIVRDTFYDVVAVIQSNDGVVRRGVALRVLSNNLRNGTARQLIISKIRAVFSRWLAKTPGEVLIYARRA
jgi:hypothetical protein